MSGRTFFPNLSKFITFEAAPLVSTPFVRNQGRPTELKALQTQSAASTGTSSAVVEALNRLHIYIYIYIEREREGPRLTSSLTVPVGGSQGPVPLGPPVECARCPPSSLGLTARIFSAVRPARRVIPGQGLRRPGRPVRFQA